VFDIWTFQTVFSLRISTILYLFTEGIETERTILKLHLWESFLLSQLISDFNNRSDKYKVVVEDYSKYDEGEEGAGLTKLNTEIQAGNIPDIIDFSHIPARYYEEKGLLADLYPYIDADPEIERSDLFSAYLNTYEREALYRALQFFSIICLV
jgi:ABC-type glycerol-3-phosphate transport system substrate-binding protein